MATRKLQVVIAGDDRQLEQSFASAGRNVGRFEQRFGRAESRLSSFGRSAQSAGRSMTRGLTLPIIGFGALAFQELNAGAEAMAQTEAVIRSTGGAAERSAPQIVELAQSLSELSSIDDEDIQGMLNKLMTFTQITGGEFDSAASAITDLSVAMGIDLDAAVLQVGKALNDPIRGLTSLTRVGVTFSNRQREWIEHLVEFGDVAGAQRVILAELNREFGGSAEAFGQTPAARLRRLGQRFEELGASILENAMPALEDFGGVLEGLANKYDNLTPTQQKFVAGAIALAAVAGPLTSVIGMLTTALGALATVLGISGGMVFGIILAVVALGAALYLLVTNWDTVKMAMQNFITNAANNIPGVRFAIDQVNFAIARVREALRALSAVASTTWGVLQRLGSIALDGLRGAIALITGDLRGALSAAQSLISTLSSALSIGNELDKVGTNIPRGDSMDSRPGPRSIVGGKTQGRSGRGRRIASRQSVRPAPVLVVGGLR